MRQLVFWFFVILNSEIKIRVSVGQELFCVLVTAGKAYVHIPSCCCFHTFFCWVSSVAPADERRQTSWVRISRTLKQAQRHTHMHTRTQKHLCEISLSASGDFGSSRAVWSQQGQTVARHPEELPLCLCAATSCNLLLRDKTKLTRHFTADPAHQVWLPQLWRDWDYETDEWSLSIMMILNFHCTLTHTIKHLHTGVNVSFVFLTLWYSRLFSHSNNLWIDRLVCWDWKTNVRINTSSRTLITPLSTLTGNSKQPPLSDLWTGLPIYQLVISTLLSLIPSGNVTFKWHTLELGKSGAL